MTGVDQNPGRHRADQCVTDAEDLFRVGGVKVFLEGLGPQVPAKTGDLGEAAGLPVFLEDLLNEKPFLRRQRTFDLDSLIVVLQVVEPVVEKVQVQNVLPLNQRRAHSTV